MYRIETFSGKIKYVSANSFKQDRERFDGETLESNGIYTLTKGDKTATATPCIDIERVYWDGEGAVTCDYKDPVTKTIDPRYADMMPLLKGQRPAKVAMLHALYKSGVRLMTLRHLWNVDIKYAEVNGGPALSLGKTVSKTGKVLKKLLPKGTPDKVVQSMATTLNHNNTYFLRHKELMDFEIHDGLSAAEKGDELGSCMHGKDYWENMDEFLFPSQGHPDFSSPPPENCGPYTVLWMNVSDKQLLNGSGNLRLFVWPVTMEDGSREWYVDRVYPANGQHTNKWVAEWAEQHDIKHINTEYYGTSDTGCYTDRALAQPAMSHRLMSPIDTDNSLPWLDTFRNVSSDLLHLMSPASKAHSVDDNIDTHDTEGNWGDSNRCTCSECGDGVDEGNVFCVDDGSYCESCYDHNFISCVCCCESCRTEDAIRTDDGNYYCSASCANSENYYPCAECGDYHDIALGTHIEDGDSYCSDSCAIYAGHERCPECLEVGCTDCEEEKEEAA